MIGVYCYFGEDGTARYVGKGDEVRMMSHQTKTHNKQFAGLLGAQLEALLEPPDWIISQQQHNQENKND